MKIISICIGSSCYIKDSYYVVEDFKNFIKEYNLEDKIELQASFCLEQCTEGVCIKRWDGVVLSANKENTRELFENDILAYL